MMNTIWPVAVPIIVVLFVASRLKVLPENSRFAVSELGNFSGLKGPGVLFKWKGSTCHWVRISVGDRGEVVAPGLARFQKVDVPVAAGGGRNVGEFLRVTGFSEGAITAVRDQNQARVITCEKCGHENAVT